MKKHPRFTTRLGFALLVAVSPLGFSALPPTACAQEHGDAAKVVIPETVPAIWAEINKHQGELAATIQSKKLADVHHHAYAIRDLVAALVPLAKPDTKARVAGASKNTAALAEKLDAAGDNNKQGDAEAGFKQLEIILKQLKAQFPEVV